jgi:hypothetical protein
MFFQGGGIRTYLIIGLACVMLAVLVICSILASWEEVTEDKPIPPVPEMQEVNGTPDKDSQGHSVKHASANGLRLGGSQQCPSQPAIEVQSGFLTPSTVV